MVIGASLWYITYASAMLIAYNVAAQCLYTRMLKMYDYASFSFHLWCTEIPNSLEDLFIITNIYIFIIMIIIMVINIIIICIFVK